MQSSPSQTYHSNRTTNHSSVTYRPWEPDRDVTECRQCQRPFHFLLRRHHCRSCGQVVCDRCSSHRLRLLPTTMVEDPSVPVVLYPVIAQQPQRVCSACFLLAQHRGVAMKKSSSRQSRMVECPMCGVSLLHYPLAEQEHHVADCLNRGSPPVHRPRYLVHRLSKTSPQLKDECPICFEDFEAGDSVARMVCLCSYHAHCLGEWLERGKGCPVHDHDALSSFGS